MTTPTLFPIVTVHCFFDCPETVTAVDPQSAHDLMEQHYDSEHSAQIGRVVAGLDPYPSRKRRRSR